MYQNYAVVSGSDRELSPKQLGSAIAELLTALNSTLNDERESAEESLTRVAAILQPFRTQEAEAIQPVRGGLAPWQVRKVNSYIEANLDRAIRSGELAELLDLSPCHFSRAFRNSFGNSPLEHVIRRRIERAQGLMLSTDAPLCQIALECGLSDQAHFSRLFRRIVGETPKVWRRARISPDHSAVSAVAPLRLTRAQPYGPAAKTYSHDSFTRRRQCDALRG